MRQRGVQCANNCTLEPFSWCVHVVRGSGLTSWFVCRAVGSDAWSRRPGVRHHRPSAPGRSPRTPSSALSPPPSAPAGNQLTTD